MLLFAPHVNLLALAEKISTFSENHKIIKNQVFTICYGADYKLVELADGQALISGSGFYGTANISDFKDISRSQLTKYITDTVGYFSAVIISERNIALFSSLYRYKDIFYWKYQGEWFVSDDLSNLNQTVGPCNFNIGYMRDFVLDCSTFGPETIFEDISQIELGTVVTFSEKLGLERAIGNFPLSSQQPLIDTLMNNIKLFILEKTRVIVRFSGGLDSSLILGIAKELVNDCGAVHIIIQEEVHSTEVEIAQQIAEYLKCPLSIIQSKYSLSAKRKCFSGSKTITSPFEVYPYSDDATDRKGAFLGDISVSEPEKTLFLSGQGGDNVFIQNPPPVVIKDTLLAHGPWACVREAVKYSRLKNTPIFDVLRKAFKSEILHADYMPCLFDAPEVETHLLLHNERKGSAKFYHIRSILEAYQQYETPIEFGVTSLHPLLLQNIVAMAFNVEVSDHYTNMYDRIIERQLLYDRYATDVAWRRTKKSSSIAVFKFFMNNKDLIYDTLAGGLVAPALSIDLGWLRQEIDYNGSVTLRDSFGIIINLLRLEIFCQQHSSRLKH